MLRHPLLPLSRPPSRPPPPNPRPLPPPRALSRPLPRHRRPPAARTRIMVVGRGSSDPTAESQLRGFAESAFAEADGKPAAIGLGFVAAARPTLGEAIAAAAAGGEGRVVVGPHLLFHGHVETQVAERVERARREHPSIDWVVVGRLGADRRVATAVAERAREAIAGGG